MLLGWSSVFARNVRDRGLVFIVDNIGKVVVIGWLSAGWTRALILYHIYA
jgi:hypothetical protein